jgi:hypothetical protein
MVWDKISMTKTMKRWMIRRQLIQAQMLFRLPERLLALKKEDPLKLKLARRQPLDRCSWKKLKHYKQL